MLIYFIDINNIIHTELIPEGQTLNQTCNVEILKHSREFVPHKRSQIRPLAQPGLLGRGRRSDSVSVVSSMWPMLDQTLSMRHLVRALEQCYVLGICIIIC